MARVMGRANGSMFITIHSAIPTVRSSSTCALIGTSVVKAPFAKPCGPAVWQRSIQRSTGVSGV